MHQKSYTTIAVCICFILTACFSEVGENNTDGRRFDIEFPSQLTEETADLIITDVSGDARLLDLATIQDLPSVSFETVDPWDEKRERFTGVPLYRLLKSLDMIRDTDDIIIVAENGYEARIKISDLQRYEYILAYMIDGKNLGETEELTRKGKLIIAINFDKHADISIEVYKNHLVWQVAGIVSNGD